MQSEAVGGSTICLHAMNREHWPFWASFLCSEARPSHRPNRLYSAACSTVVAQEGRTKRAISFRTPSEIKGPCRCPRGSKDDAPRVSAAGLVVGPARTGKLGNARLAHERAPGRRSNGWMPVVRGGFPARLNYSLEECDVQ